MPKPTLALGKPVPDFELEDTNGKNSRLSDYCGKQALAQIIQVSGRRIYLEKHGSEASREASGIVVHERPGRVCGRGR